jgi:hypothetical protein
MSAPVLMADGVRALRLRKQFLADVLGDHAPSERAA